MFEESVFKSEYKRAYDRITPGRECLCRLKNAEEERRKMRRAGIFTGIGTAVAGLALLCLITALFLPAAAKASPRVYAAVVRYAPALADYCLPEEYECTRAGITMRVEAINVEGNRAQVVVSFSDAEDGGDLIRGKAELFGNYGLTSYGAEGTIGGSGFLGYDEEEDKAYFKVDVTAGTDFDGTKMTLSVYSLFTDCREEIREIPLNDIVRDPEVKAATLFGKGGINRELYEGQHVGRDTENSYAFIAKVMDTDGADRAAADDLTVTGIGYGDGILRVQVCRGSSEDAERHMMLYLADETNPLRPDDGSPSWQEEAADKAFLRSCEVEDFSVGWTEETDGGKLVFDEFWFALEESMLADLRLYGISFYTQGCVKGNWEVTFKAE